MHFERITDGVFGVSTAIRLSPGFELPLRSTVVALASGGLAVISPVDFDDASAARLEALGPVEHIVAPNLLHHLFVAKAAARWPSAKVHVAPGLTAKRPDLRPHHTLGDGGLPPDLEGVLVEGAPALGETVLLHRASRTLVVTDLVFHVLEPRGLLTPLILWLVGARGALAQSRALRFVTKDRAAAGRSARAILGLDFDRLVPAHGAIVESGARPRLEAALHWMLAGAAPALPAPA